MTGAPCAICRKPARPEFSPFCSKRCADIDLSRWLKGAYAIPGEYVSEDGQAGGQAEKPAAPEDFEDL